MPKLVVPNPTAAPTTTPPAVGQPTSMSTATVDNRVTPVRSLLSTLDGSAWSVDFYLHHVGKHNDLQQLDPSSQSALRPLTVVKGMEIFVERGLEDSTDPNSGVTTVTGSANVPPSITPNVNDYFIADGTVGRKAVYRITNVIRKSFTKDTVYNIEYQLVEYYDVNSDISKQLIASTVQTYVYDSERARTGNLAILQEDSADRISRLRDWMHSATRMYLRENYVQRIRNIAVTDQGLNAEEEVLDVYVAWFIDRIVDSTGFHTKGAMFSLPIQGEHIDVNRSVWGVLYERDRRSLKRVRKNFGPVAASVMQHSLTALRQLCYTGARHVMMDLDVRGDSPSITWLRDNAAFEGRVHTVAGVTVPWVYPVHKEHYVFSDAFYASDKTMMSVLEIQLTDYLQNNRLNGDILEKLTQEHDEHWPLLERFYYAPALFLLIQNYIREITL